VLLFLPILSDDVSFPAQLLPSGGRAGGGLRRAHPAARVFFVFPAPIPGAIETILTDDI
jgi:hypothetical protein